MPPMPTVRHPIPDGSGYARQPCVMPVIAFFRMKTGADGPEGCKWRGKEPGPATTMRACAGWQDRGNARFSGPP